MNRNIAYIHANIYHKVFFRGILTYKDEVKLPIQSKEVKIIVNLNIPFGHEIQDTICGFSLLHNFCPTATKQKMSGYTAMSKKKLEY